MKTKPLGCILRARSLRIFWTTRLGWLVEVEAAIEIAGVEEDAGPRDDESESGAKHIAMLATPPVFSDTPLKGPRGSGHGFESEGEAVEVP